MRNTVVKNGYLARASLRGAAEKGKRTRKSYRDWWLIKHYDYGGVIQLSKIYFNKEMVGKKVRLKVEIIGDVYER